MHVSTIARQMVLYNSQPNISLPSPEQYNIIGNGSFDLHVKTSDFAHDLSNFQSKLKQILPLLNQNKLPHLYELFIIMNGGYYPRYKQAIYKQDSYFMRLFSNENWTTWIEDKTNLGIVLQSFLNFRDSPNFYTKNLSIPILISANDEARILLLDEYKMSQKKTHLSTWINNLIGYLLPLPPLVSAADPNEEGNKSPTSGRQSYVLSASEIENIFSNEDPFDDDEDIFDSNEEPLDFDEVLFYSSEDPFEGKEDRSECSNAVNTPPLNAEPRDELECNDIHKKLEKLRELLISRNIDLENTESNEELSMTFDLLAKCTDKESLSKYYDYYILSLEYCTSIRGMSRIQQDSIAMFLTVLNKSAKELSLAESTGIAVEICRILTLVVNDFLALNRDRAFLDNWTSLFLSSHKDIDSLYQSEQNYVHEDSFYEGSILLAKLNTREMLTIDQQSAFRKDYLKTLNSDYVQARPGDRSETIRKEFLKTGIGAGYFGAFYASVVEPVLFYLEDNHHDFSTIFQPMTELFPVCSFYYYLLIASWVIIAHAYRGFVYGIYQAILSDHIIKLLNCIIKTLSNIILFVIECNWVVNFCEQRGEALVLPRNNLVERLTQYIRHGFFRTQRSLDMAEAAGVNLRNANSPQPLRDMDRRSRGRVVDSRGLSEEPRGSGKSIRGVRSFESPSEVSDSSRRVGDEDGRGTTAITSVGGVSGSGTAETHPETSDTLVISPSCQGDNKLWAISSSPIEGLMFQKVPGDGHCLFRTFALYFGEDVAHWRRKVTDHMEENQDVFLPFHAGDEAAFSKRLQAIRDANPDEEVGIEAWGDQPEIVAIQRITNRPVIIFRENANPVIPDNLADYEGQLPIFLFYNGATHYDAFIVEDDHDLAEILQSILRRLANGESVRFHRTLPSQKALRNHTPHASEKVISATENSSSSKALRSNDSSTETTAEAKENAPANRYVKGLQKDVSSSEPTDMAETHSGDDHSESTNSAQTSGLSTSTSTLFNLRGSNSPKLASVREQLEETPHEGLVFLPVPGDGHCLFHAVGLYLGEDADFLRRIVTAHMEANPADFIDFHEGGEEEFTQRLKAIRETDAWGDQPEIEAIQRTTGRPVIIFRQDANPTIPDNLAEYHEPPIFLFYNGVTHYDAFIVRDGNDPVEILRCIQERIANGEIVNFDRVVASQNVSSNLKAAKDTPQLGAGSVISQAAPKKDGHNRPKHDNS